MKFLTYKLSAILFAGTGCIASVKTMNIEQLIKNIKTSNLSINSNTLNSADIQKELNKHQTAIKEKNEEIKTTSNKKEQVKKLIEDEVQKITTGEKQVKEWKNKVEVFINRISYSSEELNEAKKQKNKTNKEIQKITTAITQTTEEIAKLNDKIQETGVWLKDLRATTGIKANSKDEKVFAENAQKITRLITVMNRIHEKNIRNIDLELIELHKSENSSNNQAYIQKREQKEQSQKKHQVAIDLLTQAHEKFSNKEALSRDLQIKLSQNSNYFKEQSQEVKNSNINFTNNKNSKTTQKNKFQENKLNAEKQIGILEKQETDLTKYINQQIGHKTEQETLIKNQEIEIQENKTNLANQKNELNDSEKTLTKQLIEKNKQIKDMMDFEEYLD